MQEQVNKIGNETGYEIFQMVSKIENKLLKKCLNSIIEGTSLPTKLQPVGGSYHRGNEIHEIKKKEFWSTLPKDEAKRLYRCLIFPGQENLEGWNQC